MRSVERDLVGSADNMASEPQQVLGEADDRAYRNPLCTSVLIRTRNRAIVVDPSLQPAGMPSLLDRRPGLSIPEVDTVFLTHFHGDHRFGKDAFPEAEWLMAGEVVSAWRDEPPENDDDRRVLDRLREAPGETAPDIALLATPGHTLNHHSLVFDAEGLRFVVAGDAAMTRDFIRARDYYFNTADTEAAVWSIEEIATTADMAVPGHDNHFLIRRERHGHKGASIHYARIF
jgi:glyoxylase-like metal-dependent hydrolase (beta-lactamase superfamily II)